MDLDDIFNKWSDWLEKIHHEVVNLTGSRFVFLEVRKMLDTNPKIQLPSVFWTHFQLNYIAYEIMAIRRIVDNRGDSISLIRLLNEIIDYPSVLSRQRFCAIYTDDALTQEIAESNYNRFYNNSKQHIEPDFVREDIDELIVRSGKCKVYADRILAHNDSRGVLESEMPYYEDLNACIDYIEILIKKYSEIFHSRTLINTVPNYEYDWKAIFRVPWIEK